MQKSLASFLAVCALAYAVAGVTARAQDASAAQKAESAKPLTLTGCLAKDATAQQVLLSDPAKGTYRLRGVKLERYVGQRVQVTGIRLGGLHIVGGLLPSPTLAAQAGAVDPGQAAIASLPGGAAHGVGVEAPPEVQVSRLQAKKGDCP